MSIKSWKEEFYPVTAKEVNTYGTDKELIEHSLKKWNGLRKENLEKHQIAKGHYSLSDIEKEYFSADGGSCALCQRYDDNCEGCPLEKVRGSVACSDETKNEDIANTRSPWHEWTHNDNPEPMIFWLNVAKEATND